MTESDICGQPTEETKKRFIAGKIWYEHRTSKPHLDGKESRYFIKYRPSKKPNLHLRHLIHNLAIYLRKSKMPIDVRYLCGMILYTLLKIFKGPLYLICIRHYINLFIIQTNNLGGIWCKTDVVSTSMRRHNVASTLIRRHFCPLGKRLGINVC